MTAVDDPVTTGPVSKAGRLPKQTVAWEVAILLLLLCSLILSTILCSAKQDVPTDELARTRMTSKSLSALRTAGVGVYVFTLDKARISIFCI